MKKLFSLLFIIAGFTAAGQTADPYISIQTVPAIIPLNTNTNLVVNAGNNSVTGSIVANSLRITISAGNNAEILGIAGGSDARWSVTGFDFNGTGNTMYMVNTGVGIFAFPNNLGVINVNVKGTVVGGPQTLSGNITYITANNPLLPGNGLNSIQGNTNNTNDNSTTSLTVITVVGLRLTEFKAAADGCAAQLSWATAGEDNFKGFEIERSLDGRNFFNIGKVTASGNSAGSTYHFNTDQASGKGYFRLKMLDNDGKYTYSEVVYVNTRCQEKSVTIVPNPVADNQVLTVTLSGHGLKVKGELITSLGQVLKTYYMSDGVNTLKMSNVDAKGTYQLRITAEDGAVKSYNVVLLK